MTSGSDRGKLCDNFRVVNRLPLFAALSSLLLVSGAHAAPPEKNQPMKFGIVIHGGAGTIERQSMTAANEEAHRAGLEQAARAGYEILKKNGTSLDAIEAAIRVLEDNPLFNAGKGAVFTHDGTNELDASIMDGKTLKAGAIAAVQHIRNPIALARMVMEKSPHVLLVGAGAEAFAKEKGMPLVDAKYFYTDERWQALQKILDKVEPGIDKEKHGTVGAVALDQAGNLAAGTSTGGTTNKLPGRIGDSPIIGAGTYADNRTCAVSCTGDGEYFIRSAVAHDLSAMMDYKGLTLMEAAQSVIEKVGKLGGTGGLIAIDKEGNFAMPFNTSGMYRAQVSADGKITVEIYR
jgi:beta-aspartyl-peptidase (threonine type)